jgi:hypothetical protein
MCRLPFIGTQFGERLRWQLETGIGWLLEAQLVHEVQQVPGGLGRPTFEHELIQQTVSMW